MSRFRDTKTLQKFATVHASIHNHFNQGPPTQPPRHLQADPLGLPWPSGVNLQSERPRLQVLQFLYKRPWRWCRKGNGRILECDSEGGE